MASAKAIERLILQASEGVEQALSRLSKLAGKPVTQEGARSALQAANPSLDSLVSLPSSKKVTGRDLQEMFARNDPNATEAALAFMKSRVEANARRFIPSRGTEHYDDLIQSGNEAVLRGLQRFGRAKEGTSLESWLTQHMQQGMSNYLRAQGSTVKLPSRTQAAKSRINKKEAEWEKLAGRKPSDEELGAQLGMSPDELLEIRGGIGINVPLNPVRGSIARDREYIKGGLDKVPESLRTDAPTLERRTELMDKLAGSKEQLGPAKKGILDAREVSMLSDSLGLGPDGPMSQRQIAAKYGVDQTRVGQLIRRAVQKIQKQNPEWKPPKGNISGGSEEPFGFTNIPEGSPLNRANPDMTPALDDVRNRISDVLRDFWQGARKPTPDADPEIVRQLQAKQNAGHWEESPLYGNANEDEMMNLYQRDQSSFRDIKDLEAQRPLPHPGYDREDTINIVPRVQTGADPQDTYRFPLMSIKGDTVERGAPEIWFRGGQNKGGYPSEGTMRQMPPSISGGSIIADESGKPKIYFHGTPTAFRKFDAEKMQPGLMGKNLYATDDPRIAGGGKLTPAEKAGWPGPEDVQGYANKFIEGEKAPNVHPLFLDADPLLNIDDPLKTPTGEAFFAKLKSYLDNFTPRSAGSVEGAQDQYWHEKMQQLYKQLRRKATGETSISDILQQFGRSGMPVDWAWKDMGYNGLIYEGGHRAPTGIKHEVVVTDPRNAISPFSYEGQKALGYKFGHSRQDPLKLPQAGTPRRPWEAGSVTEEDIAKQGYKIRPISGGSDEPISPIRKLGEEAQQRLAQRTQEILADMRAQREAVQSGERPFSQEVEDIFAAGDRRRQSRAERLYQPFNEDVHKEWQKQMADEDFRDMLKLGLSIGIPAGGAAGYLGRSLMEDIPDIPKPTFKTFPAEDSSMRKGFYHPGVGVHPDKDYNFSQENVSRERLHLLRDLNRRGIPYTIDPDTKEAPTRLRRGAEG